MKTFAVRMTAEIASVHMPAVFETKIDKDGGKMRVWWRGIDITESLAFAELVEIEALAIEALKKGSTPL